MRPIAVLAASAFLLMPAAGPLQAHHAEGGNHKVVGAGTYASAAKSKARKIKVKNPKAQKHQYLRAVPSR